MSTSPSPITVDLKGQLGDFKLAASFSAPAKGVTALFGPSGCGKTTILRCIAGLERLKGEVRIGGEVWQDSSRGIFLPTHKRHIGYVFQEASLFPHMDVKSNLVYGAKRAQNVADRNVADFDAIVHLLGISHLLDRSPVALSGGERQRVAVGRALLSSPRVLLMDEPLSALDRITKEEILPYFEMLHETLALPVIYITHDFTEIERLADTVVLIEKGHVTGRGSLAQLQTDPSLPLLKSRDASVVIEGRIAEFDRDFGLTRLTIDGGEIWVPGQHGAVGDIRRLSIAVSDVSLARTDTHESTIVNSLPARIITIDGRPQEPQASVILSLGSEGSGCKIAARITRRSLHHLGFEPGQQVFAQIKSVALVASRTANEASSTPVIRSEQ